MLISLGLRLFCNRGTAKNVDLEVDAARPEARATSCPWFSHSFTDTRDNLITDQVHFTNIEIAGSY